MNKFVKYALVGVMAAFTLFAAGCGGDKKEEKKIDMNKPVIVGVNPGPHAIIMENVNIQGENVNISKQIRIDKNRIDEIRKDDRGSAAADKVIHKYEQMIGFITPAVMEGIDFVIGEGMETELVSRIIEYACEQGKRSWQYINAALLGNLKENILTLDAYNRHQAERTECKAFQQKTPEKKAKRSKFNNYNDSNKKDYSKIQEDILKELLEE